MYDIEIEVLEKLNFSLHFDTPIDFMDRFIMLLCNDQTQEEMDLKLVKRLTTFMLKFTLKFDEYLDYKPS